MKALSDYFHKPLFEQTTARNEREELIENIRARLNSQREGTQYKPLPFMAVATKLKGMDTKELYGFYKECNDSGCFSKCFFGKLKKPR